MANVLVLGAGLAGLSTALLLARDGHAVTVLERDPAPPGRPEDAWDKWERPGVSQFRLGHQMLPRWYREMREAIPEVLTELEANGGYRFNLIGRLPESMRGPRRPDDTRFETLIARRPVLEAVLAAVADRTVDLVVRRGVTVTGLTIAERTPRPAVPHVTGVVIRGGGSLRADLVVDCGGRRSVSSRWLTEIGVRDVVEEREDAGFVYYGRHFRNPGGNHPEMRVPGIQMYNSVTMLTLPADRSTWSVLIVARSDDTALRPLRDPRRWQAALARYPLVAPWGAGDGAQPITDVQVMATEDRYRSLMVSDRPAVTGFVAVGDAWSSTNPWQGRGATIGLLHARLLTHVLRDTDPSDPQGLTRRFHDLGAAALEPLYRATCRADRRRLAEVACDIAGTPYDPPDPAWPVSRALRTAILTDGDALRAATDATALNEEATAIREQPGLAERILAVAGDAQRYPLPGPSRTELVDAVNDAA